MTVSKKNFSTILNLPESISEGIWKFLSFEDEFVNFEYRNEKFSVLATNVNFIHDFTFNLLGKQTDFNLDGVTPDLILGDDVYEFGTVYSYDEKIVHNAFSMKYDKYALKTSKLQKNLNVIVVSPCFVVYQGKFNQEQIREFHQRYLVSLEIRQKIAEDYNRNYWFASEENKIGRILKIVLDSAPSITAKNDFERTMNAKLQPPTEKDVEDYLKLCVSRMKNFDLTKITIDKTEDYKLVGDRTDYKRVIPFSLIVPTKNSFRMTERVEPLLFDSDLDDVRIELNKAACTELELTYDLAKEERIALELEDEPKEKTKKMYRIKVNLTQNQRIELALNGVQAKSMLKDSSIAEKRIQDKKTFGFNSPVDDIEQFINSNTLGSARMKLNDFGESCFKHWTSEYVKYFKHENSEFDTDTIIKDYKSIVSTELIDYTSFIQALVTEINLSVRENLGKDTFVVKPIPGYDADVYIKCSGSIHPVFFFVIGRLEKTFNSMTVGTKYDISEGHFITDWSSIKLRDIESYLSLNTKMIATFAYLKQLQLSEKALMNHMNYVLLLALSNKDRDEEINTLLRYVYMRACSITDNVTDLVSKLPEFARSRLNVYQIKLTIDLMKKLHHKKPKVTKNLVNKEKMLFDRDVSNLCDLFGNEVNFKQALNFCYYGYVVNKQKQIQVNQSSKLMDKILEYDLKVDQGKTLSGVKIENLKDHLHNKSSLSVLCEFAKQRLMSEYGTNYFPIFNKRLVADLSHFDLYSLSTIKASAKQDMPNEITADGIKQMRERRPKVVENLKMLCDDFGHKFEHPIELVNYCIKQIDKKDCFNVELFSKDQHAGIREIYIVDIRVRIVQWFIESISRTLCSFFESETMTHPSMKEKTSQRLTRKIMSEFNEPVMICRSGDASKWSQTQNVTKFYQVLCYFLPNEYHKIIRSILILWFRKKIYIPPNLIEVCLKANEPTTNSTINFMKSVYSGEIKNRRLGKNSPFMRIRTGFMQGILHYTSSFFHTIVQEGFMLIKDWMVREVFKVNESKEVFRTIILQGSDDNSETIFVPREYYDKKPFFFNILVQLKDIMSDTVGIKVSVEKTASCVPFLMEYNSMWEIAGKFIMPTIKFIFVSTEIPAKQTLLGRQEYYYELLGNCIEKGATIKTANLVRIAQSKQHYLQLGLGHNNLFSDFYQSLLESKDPSLGYFMFEPIISVGLLGFDFMLFWHSNYTSFSNYIKLDDAFIPLNIIDKRAYRSMDDYSVAKVNFKKWECMYKSLDLKNVKESRENINAMPEILYNKIHDSELEWDLINLKMTDFSIKESIGARFGKSDMFSSMIYILNRKVLKSSEGTKHSLYWLVQNQSVEGNSREKIKKAFPRSGQYEKLLKEMSLLSEYNRLIDAEYIQRGSSKIKVLEGINNESYKLLDLCKRKWFGIRTMPLGDKLLNLYFNQAKSQLPWLKDTEKETRELLNCDSYTLFTYLLNTFKDSRSVMLLDTPGKQGSFSYLISRIIDVNKKLVHRSPPTAIPDVSFKNDLQTNLKFLVNFPFDDFFRIEHLKPLVKSLLTCDLKRDELMKYMMLNDVLNNDLDSFKLKLIDYNEDIKLTIFTQRQNFDVESGLWNGKGIITCMRNNLTFELIVYDDICTMIYVKTDDITSVDYTIIIKTLREMNFNLDSQVGEMQFRLNKSGLSWDKIGTQVLTNSNLHLNIDNINNVRLEFTKDRIKFVTLMNPTELIDNSPALSSLHETKSKKLTLFSINLRPYIFFEASMRRLPMTDVLNIFWERKCDYYMLKDSILNNVSGFDETLIYNEFCKVNHLHLKASDKFRYMLGTFKQEIQDEITEVVEASKEEIDEARDFINKLNVDFKTDATFELMDDIEATTEMNFQAMTEHVDQFASDYELINNQFNENLKALDTIAEMVIKNVRYSLLNKFNIDIKNLFEDETLINQLPKTDRLLLIALFNFKSDKMVDIEIEKKEIAFYSIESKPHTVVDKSLTTFDDKRKKLSSHSSDDDVCILTIDYYLEKFELVKEESLEDLKATVLSLIDEVVSSLSFIDESIQKSKSKAILRLREREKKYHNDKLKMLNTFLSLIDVEIRSSSKKEEEEKNPKFFIDKYKVFKVIGDGSCLFSSLSLSLLSLEATHHFSSYQSSRRIVSESYDKLHVELQDDLQINHKQEVQSENGWGCSNCAHVFGIETKNQIKIYDSAKEYWLTVGHDDDYTQLFIQYNGINHFDTLIPNDNVVDFINNYRYHEDEYDLLKHNYYKNQVVELENWLEDYYEEGEEESSNDEEE